MKSTNSIPYEKSQAKPDYPYLAANRDFDDPCVVMVFNDHTAYVVWTKTTYWYIGEDFGLTDENDIDVFPGEITLSNS